MVIDMTDAELETGAYNAGDEGGDGEEVYGSHRKKVPVVRQYAGYVMGESDLSTVCLSLCY